MDENNRSPQQCWWGSGYPATVIGSCSYEEMERAGMKGKQSLLHLFYASCHACPCSALLHVKCCRVLEGVLSC